MRTRNLLVAGAVPLLIAAAGTSALAAGSSYSAELAPVNHGGTGTVDLHQTGTHLDVDLHALGLDDGTHVAHIHGIKQAQAECPSLAADTNADGFVDFLEGLPDYGPVVRTLSNGTSDRGTSLAYERTFKHLDNGDGVASLGPLDQYAVVIHGVDLDGDGLASNPDVQGDGADADDNEISMPALCGEIVRH
jgi:hypothetical protein